MDAVIQTIITNTETSDRYMFAVSLQKLHISCDYEINEQILKVLTSDKQKKDMFAYLYLNKCYKSCSILLNSFDLENHYTVLFHDKWPINKHCSRFLKLAKYIKWDGVSYVLIYNLIYAYYNHKVENGASFNALFLELLMQIIKPDISTIEKIITDFNCEWLGLTEMLIEYIIITKFSNSLRYAWITSCIEV